MKSLYILLLYLPLLCACEKLLLAPDQASTNPEENFEYLWHECNDKYAYFDLKKIDWERIKIEYRAKIYEGMSDDSLFRVLGEMMTELRDDHANLISDFNVSFYGTEYLGQDNFDWRLVVDQYISQDYYISGPFSHNFIKDRNIGYIRLASFTGTIDASNLDFILQRYADTQGLIIDIRENGGGAIEDVFTLISRFVEQETMVQYTRIKTGPEHNQFSVPKAVFVQPYNGIRYTNKVVILTDRGTYSSGSLFALASKALPQLILMGDTTGGGLGMPNGGQLPNGWTYRFSITQTLDLDKQEEFENGVPPDIEVLVDWNERSTDEILERAILELE